MNAKYLHFGLILPFSVAICATGCIKMYTLPDAPPKSEWVEMEAEEEAPEVATRRFLDAKRAAIQCFAALADRNWDKAMQWMTPETVAYFEEHSNGEGAASVFESGTIWVDGEAMSFDPVGDVFIHALADIRDEFGDRKDKETKTRKVLYAVSSSGEAREIVFVQQGDRWALEKTQLSSELLAE